MPVASSYFVPVDRSRYQPTVHVGGAWSLDEQHIAPALGLLAHAVEADRDTRRADGLVLGRVSFDILGTVPLACVDAEVSVLRPGRTIELVEARLRHDGRVVVILRAWLLARYQTTSLAGTSFPAMPAPSLVPAWDPTSVWPGGFIASVTARREQVATGRARVWVRTGHALVAGVPVSTTAGFIGLLDIANGIAVRVPPAQAAYPNVDLTAHLFRAPVEGWLGLDTTVSFGPDGAGLTQSVVHDEHGPIGTVVQCLTVRPSPAQPA